MNIEDLYLIFKKFPSIITDNRKAIPNSIFFGLSGEQFDGNTFAESAIQSGCNYAVIDKKEFAKGDQYILVENVLDTLQKLATYHRSQLNIPIIGITGSNGKTTTKELIHSVLSKKYNCYSTKGNFNNHIGVPLSVLEINEKHEIAVIEMGANHIGEINDLCHISCPTSGIITNIGKAHLEGFGGVEGVIKAKGELYNYLRKRDSPIFINGDNPTLESMSSDMNKVTYGSGTENSIVGQIEDSSEFLSFNWKKHDDLSYCDTITTNLLGQYNFENALAAITIGVFFNVSSEDIKTGLESYIPSNNRSQLIKKGGHKIYMDAYNANPVSMKLSIENLDKVDHPNKLLILGDMKELGTYSEQEHQNIIELLRAKNLTDVIIVGPEFEKTEHHGIQAFSNVQEVADQLAKSPIKDSVVLIKGSRGIQLEKILDCF